MIVMAHPEQEHQRQEYYARYAERLSKRFQTGMLANLQDKPFWVLWKPQIDEQGNIHKRPYTPKGYPASIYKPHQWASLDNTLEALATGNYAGIGLMLPAPYILIDKDAKPDAPIYDRTTRQIVSPLARRLLQQVPSYAELSPNNGLHIITEGTLERGNFKAPDLEVYTNWFSTVTTKHIPGTPLGVANQQAALATLEQEFHPPAPTTTFQNTVGGERGTTRLYELPPEAESDLVLQALLRGDISRYGGDQSKADFVLLMKLLHWTGDDKALVRAIFLASPLGQREKAQEPEGEGRRGSTNYIDRTIDHILQRRRNPPMKR